MGNRFNFYSLFFAHLKTRQAFSPPMSQLRVGNENARTPANKKGKKKKLDERVWQKRMGGRDFGARVVRNRKFIRSSSEAVEDDDKVILHLLFLSRVPFFFSGASLSKIQAT